MDASGDGCLGVRRESLNVLQHGGRLRRTIHHMLLFGESGLLENEPTVPAEQVLFHLLYLGELLYSM